jgi:hypothetical protein
VENKGIYMRGKIQIYSIVLLTGFCIITLSTNNSAKLGIIPGTNKGNAENQEQKTLTKAERWALGCSAVLMERNHSRHDKLSPKEINEKNFIKIKKLLDEGWDIQNRKSFFESLAWLEEGGHRKSFNELGETIFGLTEEQYKSIVNTSNQDLRNKISVVKQYYHELGGKSILGWDYTRYICLCRWGYLAGYITEEEAWGKILPAAKMLQKKFDSWEDLGQNYLIGRKFWSYTQTKEGGQLYDDAFQRLLDMRSSPWNIYPWDMNLDDSNSPDTSEKKNPDPNNTDYI